MLIHCKIHWKIQYYDPLHDAVLATAQKRRSSDAERGLSDRSYLVVYKQVAEKRRAHGLRTMKFAKADNNFIGLDWIGLDWTGLDWTRQTPADDNG